MVPQLAEVLRAQPEQRRAVELRVAADVVVGLGRELVAVLVVPELGSPIPALDEHRRRAPVLPFTREVVAAFQEQHALARRCQPMRQRAAAGPGADDDHVIVLVACHISIQRRGPARFIIRDG